MSGRSVAPEDYEVFSRSTDSDVGIEQHAEPAPAPALTWQPKEYSRVEPGTYKAAAIRFQGPQWARTFGRWSMLIEFELLDSGAKVCAFYNFGRNPKAPRIAERGYYFRDWCKANGGKPRPGDKMAPGIFLSRAFAVEVRDCESGAYSIISGIESNEAPKETSTQATKQEATKQEAFKQSSISTNEAIKPASNQATKQPSNEAPKQLLPDSSHEGEAPAAAVGDDPSPQDREHTGEDAIQELAF